MARCVDFCVLLILQSFWCGIYGSATGIVQLTQQLPQQPICLGDEVVYLCTVPGNAIIWGTPVGDFAVTEGTETPQQGGYVARKVRYDGINNCLTASLAFIAENQTMITCENSARSLQNSTTIGLEGLPSAPHFSPLTERDIIPPGIDNIHRVTLSWTEPLLFSSRISRYVLTVSPPAPPCASGQCFVGAGERGTQFTLNTCQKYNFTVRADNCGDAQMGTESDQLAVLLCASTNNILDVMLVNTSTPANTQLQCTFLSGMTGSAVCAIQYGTDPTYMNLTYFAESSETGTAGESVNIVLREQLTSSTTYYYNAIVVSGEATVIVQGTFTTPQYNCPLSQLWNPDLHFDIISSTVSRNSRCPGNSVGNLTLTDNRTGVVTVVCYDGTAPGSAASIVCDQGKGCAPNTTGGERVCQTDTTWSGYPVICYCTSAPAPDLQTWQITLIVVIPVILIIVLMCVVLYYCKRHCCADCGKTEKTDYPVETSGSPSMKNVREHIYVDNYAPPNASPELFRHTGPLVSDPGFLNVDETKVETFPLDPGFKAELGDSSVQ